MGDRQLSRFTSSLGIVAFLGYAWFTLMPDNHSYMVGFPWVYGIELVFLCGTLWAIANVWLVREQTTEGQHRAGLQWLGGGLDWVVFGWLTTLMIGLMTTEFTQMAFMYSLINFAEIGILYGLATHCRRSSQPFWQQPLAIAQGLIGWLFIVVSLGLWLQQTVLPELQRIGRLQAVGIAASYDFSSITLRNWATFGHPNYVAGFLLLALPLLMCLVIATPSNMRWFWATGFGLGLLDFYATNSRGGWLGLLVALVVVMTILLRQATLPKRWLIWGGLSSFTALILWAIQNDRLRRTFTGLLTLGQQGGEFAYRWITTYTGWHMGLARPFTGQGLGTVPHLYQAFRPHWAGQEAESLFQLHSTPVQIWAELGLLGIGTMLLGLWLCGRLWWQCLQPEIWHRMTPADQVLVVGIGAAGMGYCTLALTDYQLDVLAIAGFLLLYVAWLSGLSQRYGQDAGQLKPIFQPLTLGMVGLTLIVAVVWLLPMNQAYAASARAFQALQREDLNTFVENLNTAYEKTPWEPYYAYQMGWTLGELALTQVEQPEKQRQLREQAIFWFQKAIAASPSYEFGQSSLAWLTLSDTPTTATHYFSRAIELMPYRRLAMAGLGESWFRRDDPEKGIEAIALEFVRFPEVATSPQWRTEQWLDRYPQILQRTDAIFTALLQQTNPNNQALQRWLHQNRGAIRWYAGDASGAAQDFQAAQHQLGQLLLALDTTTRPTWQQDLTADQQQYLQSGIEQKQPWALAIAAWLNPDQAATHLTTAWQVTGQASQPQILQNLIETLNNSEHFSDWLRNQPLLRPYRVQRIGFSVTLRRIGGNAPKDFGSFFENIPAMYFFNNTFTSLRYEPELDLAIEPYWQPLLDFSSNPITIGTRFTDN